MTHKNGKKLQPKDIKISALDLFCGVGGLTYGLIQEGVNVVAGFDTDGACEYPYEKNNGAAFLQEDVGLLAGHTLKAMYPQGHVRALVGCAPCQPFSKYTQGNDTKSDSKWSLLGSFARLIEEIEPDVISMENVPNLKKHTIFSEFVSRLDKLKYFHSHSIVFCPDYGIPQHRHRLVLFASKRGPIEIVAPTHSARKFRTVKSAIGRLPPLEAGKTDLHDPLHRSSELSELNLKRIKASQPGGTWRDWDDSLVAQCHKKENGKSYPSVYGRMSWDAPSPTITTQFFGFGNGRFGHPDQDRAISLREGAILQSFPRKYSFTRRRQDIAIKTIGRLIGNAVPVRLGKIVGRTIVSHIEEYDA